MNGTARGTVINLNAYGATVRLEDGTLASVSLLDLEKNRSRYERALAVHNALEFVVQTGGRRAQIALAPQIRDAHLEDQIAKYLKETQEWEKPDQPPAHERQFLRKKKRAALFESRHSGDR